MRNMGAILGVDRRKLEVDYFGLNHFGWFTRVLVDGEDKLPELRKHIAKFGLLTEDAAKTDPQHSDPSWVKTWRNIKPIMDNFPEYLPNPYLQYYLMPNQIVEHQNPDYTRANEVMNGREKKLFAAAEEYKRTGILPDAFHVGVHGEFIVDVAGLQPAEPSSGDGGKPRGNYQSAVRCGRRGSRLYHLRGARACPRGPGAAVPSDAAATAARL